MKIGLLEPLNIPQEMVVSFGMRLEEAGHSFVSYQTKTTDPEELVARSEGLDVVMIANNPYPDAVIRRLPDLKMIAVAFTGIDHVGLAAAKERGILVCNCAGYSDACVAEQVLGMTISLLRHFTEGNAAVRAGGTSAGLIGTEIRDKTVGIIGFGHIGGQVARLFQAFGARVVTASRSRREEMAALGIPYVTLPELLQMSDIISLHVPNNAETRGLIGEKEIALMKETAIFINCARGPIVDNAALAKALNEGRLAGAGIDVFDMEPPLPADYPLLGAKNTLLMPHVAFLTKEAMLRRAEIEFANVENYLVGKPQNVCVF